MNYLTGHQCRRQDGLCVRYVGLRDAQPEQKPPVTQSVGERAATCPDCSEKTPPPHASRSGAPCGCNREAVSSDCCERFPSRLPDNGTWANPNLRILGPWNGLVAPGGNSVFGFQVGVVTSFMNVGIPRVCQITWMMMWRLVVIGRQRRNCSWFKETN